MLKRLDISQAPGMTWVMQLVNLIKMKRRIQMPKIELDVLFKKQQRDDKKEVLDFHVMGEKLSHSDELVMMAGNMALLHVHDSETDPIPVEFKSIQRDSKKTVLKFEAKGDTQEAMIKLYEFAGH